MYFRYILLGKANIYNIYVTSHTSPPGIIIIKLLINSIFLEIEANPRLNTCTPLYTPLDINIAINIPKEPLITPESTKHLLYKNLALYSEGLLYFLQPASIAF